MVDLLKQGKKLLDQAQDMKIDPQLCNQKRRRSSQPKKGSLNSPGKLPASPPPPPTVVPPPSWAQAGVSWLKIGQLDDLRTAAVSACTRARSATPPLEPSTCAPELSLRIDAPRRSNGPSGEKKASWYTPELEPLPLIGSRNYRHDALQKVGSGSAR